MFQRTGRTPASRRQIQPEIPLIIYIVNHGLVLTNSIVPSGPREDEYTLFLQNNFLMWGHVAWCAIDSGSKKVVKSDPLKQACNLYYMALAYLLYGSSTIVERDSCFSTSPT